MDVYHGTEGLCDPHDRPWLSSKERALSVGWGAHLSLGRPSSNVAETADGAPVVRSRFVRFRENVRGSKPLLRKALMFHWGVHSSDVYRTIADDRGFSFANRLGPFFQDLVSLRHKSVMWSSHCSTSDFCKNQERPLWHLLPCDRIAIVWDRKKWATPACPLPARRFSCGLEREQDLRKTMGFP